MKKIMQITNFIIVMICLVTIIILIVEAFKGDPYPGAAVCLIIVGIYSAFNVAALDE